MLAAERRLPSSYTDPLHSMPRKLPWWYLWGRVGIWYSIMMVLLFGTTVLLAPAIGFHVSIAGQGRTSGVKFSAISCRKWVQSFDFRVRRETEGVMNETKAKGDRQHQLNRVRIYCITFYITFEIQTTTTCNVCLTLSLKYYIISPSHPYGIRWRKSLRGGLLNCLDFLDQMG